MNMHNPLKAAAIAHFAAPAPARRRVARGAARPDARARGGRDRRPARDADVLCRRGAADDRPRRDHRGGRGVVRGRRIDRGRGRSTAQQQQAVAATAGRDGTAAGGGRAATGGGRPAAGAGRRRARHRHGRAGIARGMRRRRRRVASSTTSAATSATARRSRATTSSTSPWRSRDPRGGASHERAFHSCSVRRCGRRDAGEPAARGARARPRRQPAGPRRGQTWLAPARPGGDARRRRSRSRRPRPGHQPARRDRQPRRCGARRGAPGVGVVDPGLNQPGVAGNVGGVARRSVRL